MLVMSRAGPINGWLGIKLLVGNQSGAAGPVELQLVGLIFSKPTICRITSN